ncbi:MAG: hypothetical protein CSA62_15060 [Planctomycetota bacterium]|nr:MAG: hypothetical protein CSA62_15060 [Planctomycetota bacterium]
MFVSGEVIVPFVTKPDGTDTVSIPLPNSKQLVGFVAFQEFFVGDLGNSVGLIRSNAGCIKIGQF